MIGRSVRQRPRRRGRGHRLAVAAFVFGALACSGREGAGGAPRDDLSYASQYLLERTTLRMPGVNHLMSGVASAERFVVGGPEGLLSVDPMRARRGSDSSDWDVLARPAGTVCCRVLAVGGAGYCTCHSDWLGRFDLSAGGAPRPAELVHLSRPRSEPGRLVLEGLASAGTGDTLFAAARARGVLALSPEPPFAERAFAMPPELDDAYDLAFPAPELAVVANGVRGLAILRVDHAASRATLLSRLALPGQARAVHVAEGRAYVAGFGGGGHVVDVSDPAAPRLLGSFPRVGNTFDVLPLGELVLAATGAQILAARLDDARGLRVIGLLDSPYAMSLASAAPWPGLACVAEFDTVACVGAKPGADLDADRPVLVQQGVIVVPKSSAGRTVRRRFWLRNVGGAPVVVGAGGLFVDRAPGKLPVEPFLLQPGERKTLRLELPLPADLNTNADAVPLLRVLRANGHTQVTVGLRASASLQEGDSLPRTVFQDEAGRSHDVNAAFAGRVAVLVVTAPGCQVASAEYPAIAEELEADVASGRLRAFALDPWSSEDRSGARTRTIPYLLPGLSNGDTHERSVSLETYGHPELLAGFPMPILYVLGKDGRIRYFARGFDATELRAAIEEALAEP